MIQSCLLYLIGYAGTGKYTIAKEIAKYGYVICDNHLINNPIFELVGYNGTADTAIPQAAWDTIRKLRKHVFDFVANDSDKNYVFTNVLYEDAGNRELYEQVKALAEKRGSHFFPIKLLISQEENIRRITTATRRDRHKSIDPRDTDRTIPLLTITHKNLLEFNVTNISAEEAARKIMDFVNTKKK